MDPGAYFFVGTFYMRSAGRCLSFETMCTYRL